MNNQNDLFEDDFMKRAKRTQILLALLGFVLSILGFIIFSLVVYFFFAAAGVVPPVDLIPVVPYV